MNTLLALAQVVIKELYRRKDFYVLFVLTAVITLLLGSVNLFNDDKIIRYLKELCLLLIWISSLVIAIVTTARQLPAERESRTIFPLLAKPVTRGQVIFGKFLGCWFASGIALLVFYAFFTVVICAREGQWPLVNYFQALWLHGMMLAVVIALALLGSILFSASSANTTICFIVVVGILLVGGHLNTVALQLSEPTSTLLYAVYFAIPHLEIFDVRDLVIHNQKVIGWLDCLLATFYAAAYAAFFLVASAWAFRRKSLSV
jgi:ABC-type transport system involved in multi-copper enzyme maturation permease subunit